MGAPPAPGAGRAGTHFVEALAQSSEGRAPATYRASLPYAQDAGISAGLYYLGESHAMMRFAALCRSLDVHPSGRPPALKPVGPALRAYEAEVVKAYDQAPQPLRPRFGNHAIAVHLAFVPHDVQPIPFGEVAIGLEFRRTHRLETSVPPGDADRRPFWSRLPRGRAPETSARSVLTSFAPSMRMRPLALATATLIL